MFGGYSTLGAVALQIIEDYGPVANKHGKVFERAKAHTGYTLHQMIEKVCFREGSVATSSNEQPSYIWWTMGIDKWGEINPIPDLGMMPAHVLRAKQKRGGYQQRISWPKHEMENDGPWKVVLHEELRSHDYGEDRGPQSTLYLMMRYGLSFGQRVLTRCIGDSYRSGGYDCDDWDSSWDAEVIYSAPAPAIDIPLDFPNFAAPSKFMGWRIA